MKTVALLAIVLAGCSPQEPPPQSYYLSRTIERPDGTVETWVYTGPKPPDETILPN